jgi:hypothetical protein
VAPSDPAAWAVWVQCQGMYSERVEAMLQSAITLREALMPPAAQAQQDLRDVLRQAVEECLVQPAVRLIEDCGASVGDINNGEGLFDFAIWYRSTDKHKQQAALLIRELWRICSPLQGWAIAKVSKYNRGTLNFLKEFQYLVDGVGAGHVDAITVDTQEAPSGNPC